MQLFRTVLNVVSTALVVYVGITLIKTVNRIYEEESMGVQKMQEELNKAVEREDYIAAAKYRDMIARKLSF